MKKLRELFLLSEDRKLWGSLAAVGLLLIAAVLVPLAFRVSPSANAWTEQPTRSAAALFAEFYGKGAEAKNIAVSYPEKIPAAQQRVCDTVIETLLNRFIVDQALETVAPTGSEVSCLTHADGSEMALCRMWTESRGDWQNWLDVYFDAETGQVYYLYLSRECLSNVQRYNIASYAASDVAQIMAEEYGWTLRSFEGNGESAVAVFDCAGETLCYQIDCKTFDSLIDVKICCV